jgi:hypothetical protein
MIDFDYLYKGLCALARAHKASPMAGHLGAAVVAGYFFGEMFFDLDPKVSAAIEAQLDRVIRGEESIWYDQKKAGIGIPELFEPFPEEEPRDARIATIADALARNIGKTRQSGHNVIFASIAIRALEDHPRYATPSIVDGIRKLIARFDRAGPGRGYWGKTKGWIPGHEVELDADTEFPRYRSLEAMANVVVGDLVRNGARRRRGFGGLVHVINHAAAITELSTYGFGQLATDALPAHHHHLRLWRSLPDLTNELGALRPAKHDPRTPAFWTDPAKPQLSATLTHRIKTLYGFFTLLRAIRDSELREQAEKAYLYLLA